MKEQSLWRVFSLMSSHVFRIGIKDDERLRKTDYGHSVITKFRGPVNKKGRGNFGRMTVARSFRSVNRDTHFVELLGRRRDKILEIVVPSVIDPQYKMDETRRKRVENSLRAQMIQAYLDAAKNRSNSPKRVKEKGFNRYAVGTGQTIDAIIAREVK